MGSQWRFWSNAVEESGEAYGRWVVADNLGSVYMSVHCLLVVLCMPRTTLHCFLVVYMDSRNLLIICCDYGVQWDIKFNRIKVRLELLVVTPLLCQSNWATLPWVWSAMWSILAVILWSRYNTARCVSKLYGSFNNILNVLGKRRNDMLAVHLIKTYCLPMLLYSCEIWRPDQSVWGL